jgi:hypothetical protein
MRYEQLPINTTFERARRREVYRRLAGIVTGERQQALLPLDELQARIRLFEQTYLGVRPIRVDRVVGTAGRSEDFDDNFLPKRQEVRERWMRVERAFPDGEFPPIVAYKVGDSYFVVDGHHRVAIAKQKKIEYIDAELTELRARFKIPPGAHVGELIHAEQKQLFREDSGLERTRPEAEIEFSRPDGYVELLELIKVHAYHLSVDHESLVPIAEAARDFYEEIYEPTVETIRAEGMDTAFPNHTDADLFMFVYERRRSLFAEHGSIALDEVVKKTTDETKRPARRRTARKADGSPNARS